MNMNLEMHESDHFPGAGKMVRDQFPDLTKLIMDIYPTEFDGFRLAKGVEFKPFEIHTQLDDLDVNRVEFEAVNGKQWQ